MIAGFQLTGRLALADYDAAASQPVSCRVERFATWDRQPYVAGGDYVVTVDSKR